MLCFLKNLIEFALQVYVCDFACLFMTGSKESLQPFQLANVTANTSK